MENEKYYKDQAESFLELITLRKKQPMRQKTAGLMKGEKAVMLYLFDHDQSVTAGELSRALEIGSGGIANLLNVLEKKGLIVRTMSPEDRRKIIVTLDQKGRDFITACRLEVLENTKEMLERLGRTDTEELIRILRRLAEIGDGMCRERVGKTSNAETA